MAPTRWTRALATHGRVHVNRAAEEARIKMPMVCPLTGAALADMPAVVRHVRSPAYGDALVREAGAGHLVFARE